MTKEEAQKMQKKKKQKKHNARKGNVTLTKYQRANASDITNEY